MKAKNRLLIVFITTTAPALRAGTFHRMSGNLEMEDTRSAKSAKKRLGKDINFSDLICLFYPQHKT